MQLQFLPELIDCPWIALADKFVVLYNTGGSGYIQQNDPEVEKIKNLLHLPIDYSNDQDEYFLQLYYIVFYLQLIQKEKDFQDIIYNNRLSFNINMLPPYILYMGPQAESATSIYERLKDNEVCWNFVNKYDLGEPFKNAITPEYFCCVLITAIYLSFVNLNKSAYINE